MTVNCSHLNSDFRVVKLNAQDNQTGSLNLEGRLNERCDTTKTLFNMYYQNVRSLCSKTRICFTSSLYGEYDAFVFTETWLSPSVMDSELFSSSYYVLRHDRDFSASCRSRGGGVLLGVKSEYNLIPVSVSHVSNVSPLIDIVAGKCVLGNRPILIIALYIAPDLHADLFEECLINLELVVRDLKVIIVGDFNIPQLNNINSHDMKSESCRDFLSIADLAQCNNIPNSHNRYLDLVLSNLLPSISRSNEPYFTEEPVHPALIIRFNYHTVNQIFKFPCKKINKSYNFKCTPLFPLYRAIGNEKWLTLLENVNDADGALDIFYARIYSIFDTYVPSYKFNNYKYPVWFTPDIRQAIKQKEKILLKYKKSGLSSDLDHYRNLRSQVKCNIKRAYDIYLDKVSMSIQHDAKTFWTFVNNRRRSSRLPHDMHLNEESVSSPQLIVEAFATYFSTSFDNKIQVDDAYDDDNIACDPRLSSELLKIENVTIEDVRVAIKSLNGTLTAGHDQLPAFLIKDCAFHLAPAIQLILNLILKNNSYPNCWKISKITPVFKNGNKSDISNYRPVSLLSNLSKIFESIIHRRLLTHLSSIISISQHGFMPGRSTTTNLLQICQFVSSALDRRSQVDVIYTDLSKAFDSICHKRLIMKLNRLNFHSSLVLLISSYLGNRSFYVTYNGFSSTHHKCSSGVPQGSILGPFLFLLYINDLISSINCPILAYADDIKIFSEIKDISDCIALQSSLEKIDNWSKCNGLHLNINKCAVVRYSKCRIKVNFNYSVDSTDLKVVSEVKDLGVIFDQTLSFRQHVNYVYTSCLKLCGFIFRTCNDIKNIKCIQTLYHSLIRSRLEYCAIIWNPYYQKDILKLEKIQRRYLKYVYFKIYKQYPRQNLNYSILLSCTNDKSLHYRRLLMGVKFIYNLLHNKISCQQIFSILNFSDRRVSTRNPLLFTNEIPQTNILLKSPMYVMTQNINAICNKCDIYNDTFDTISENFCIYFNDKLRNYM